MTQRALAVLALLAAVGCGGGHAAEQRADAKPEATSGTSGAESDPDFKPGAVSPTHSPPPGEGPVPLAPIYPPGHSGLVDPAPPDVEVTP